MNNYSYGSAENSYNRILAAAYVVYMIFGSYFEKCNMRNRMEESHLKLHYLSMKPSQQYELEEGLDRISADILKDVQVDDLRCEVVCCNMKESYYVCFRTGLVDYICEIRQVRDRRGRRTGKLEYKFNRVATATR